MLPLNEQAYEHILGMLRNKQFDEDEIYSETELSRNIGISRTPCRDAIHRLSQEGYFDIIPCKGFRLHKLTRQDAIETYQIRTALEMYCTIQITKAYQTEKAQALFRELEEILEKMKYVMEHSHCIEDFSSYDFQFHVKVIDYLENPQFTSIFSSYMYRMTRLAAQSLSHEGRMERTYQEHLNILDTMKAGEDDKIADVTLVHMETPKGINLDDLK